VSTAGVGAYIASPASGGATGEQFVKHGCNLWLEKRLGSGDLTARKKSNASALLPPQLSIQARDEPIAFAAA
jgi:hypothetical protein